MEVWKIKKITCIHQFVYLLLLSFRHQNLGWELKTPEQDFTGEKKKEKDDLKIGKYTDKQADMIEAKFANKQDSNSTDLELESVLGLLTPDTNNQEEEQIPVKKKKPKRGFRR